MTDGCAAHQVEREELEGKNNELSSAYLEKAKALARQKKMYDTLKGQVMASQVAVAAGDEAEHTLQTVRGNRSLDRMPGVRTGTGVYSHPGVMQHPGGGRVHNRQGSGSSGSSGQQRGGVGLGPAPTYASHLQNRSLGGRVHPGRKSTVFLAISTQCNNAAYDFIEPASVGTPRQSRLPVLGGTRQAPILNANIGPPYQPSPMMQRQSMGDNALNRGFGNSMLGVAKASRRTGGPLQR